MVRASGVKGAVQQPGRVSGGEMEPAEFEATISSRHLRPSTGSLTRTSRPKLVRLVGGQSERPETDQRLPRSDQHLPARIRSHHFAVPTAAEGTVLTIRCLEHELRVEEVRGEAAGGEVVLNSNAKLHTTPHHGQGQVPRTETSRRHHSSAECDGNLPARRKAQGG